MGSHLGRYTYLEKPVLS